LESNAENKDVLQRLKQLVFLNESLKQQEGDFKSSCVQQRAALLTLMKELKAGEHDEETKRLVEIERLHAGDLAKLSRIRQVLAKKNQEIATVITLDNLDNPNYPNYPDNPNR
jgi:hypothetical protein